MRCRHLVRPSTGIMCGTYKRVEIGELVVAGFQLLLPERADPLPQLAR
jgi:hypothetical protein